MDNLRNDRECNSGEKQLLVIHKSTPERGATGRNKKPMGKKIA